MKPIVLCLRQLLVSYLCASLAPTLFAQTPNRLKFDYIDKTLAQQQPADKLTYPGAALYPDYFEIRLHRSHSPLPTEKQYLDNVIIALFADYLALVRESNIENPQPLAIAYPYPSSGQEDRRTSFEQANRRDVIFPIRIREIESQVNLADVLSGNTQLEEQTFHLIYHLEPGRAVDIFQLRVGFFWENRLLHEQSETFRETETLEKVMLISSAIRRNLAPRETGTLSVTSTPERVSVYLNEIFFGKTPLLLDSLSPDQYTLTLRKEGFQDDVSSVTIQAGQTTAYVANMLPPKGIGSIEVITNPSGARIYNGAVFSGLTPTKLEGLPAGTIRLHLTLNGYVDEFRNFTISKDKPHHLWRLNLKEGSPEDFYRPEAPVLGPFTWYDFFIGAIVMAGGFTGSSIYFAVQRDNTRDKMLAQLSTNNPNLFTEIDKKIYRDKTAEMNRFGNYSSISLAAAGASLVFAFYSFYRHILTTDAQFARQKNSHEADRRLGMQATLQPDNWGISANYRF